jgi:hypothetical protein
MNEFWNQVWLVFVGLLPFLGFLGVCYVIVRAIFNADRNERKAQAQWQMEQNSPERQPPKSDQNNEESSTVE